VGGRCLHLLSRTGWAFGGGAEGLGGRGHDLDVGAVVANSGTRRVIDE
jgi:hypothetical protein